MNNVKSTSINTKIWFQLYIIILLCYAPFLCYFLWGNHDWEWIKTGTPLWSGVFEGRFSQFIIPTALFEGNVLPILSLSTGLAFLCLSSILLLNLWQIPPKQILYLFLAFNLVASPYTISWLYFAFLTLSCLTWPLFIIFGFYILEKQKHSLLSASATIILFTLALGGYPPVINLISVILFTLILNDLCLKKINPKHLIRKYAYHAYVIITSIILLIIFQYFLKKAQLQINTYNTVILSSDNLISKIIQCLTASFRQFVVTTSFIEYFYKYTMLCLVLLAFIKLYLNLPKKISYIFFFIVAVLGLLFSTVITLFLAQNTNYVLHEPRIEFFYLPYLYMFAATILIRSSQRCIQNLTIAILFFSCIYCFNTTANAAKVWRLGFNAENNLSERIINRIENLKNFSPQIQKYTLIQGGITNFRQKYYMANKAMLVDSYTLSAPYIPWHLPSKAYNFYYPFPFTGKNSYDVFWRFIPPKIFDNKPEIINYIRQNIAPWPDQNSVYSIDNFIILTLSPEGAGYAQSWLGRNF